MHICRCESIYILDAGMQLCITYGSVQVGIQKHLTEAEPGALIFRFDTVDSGLSIFRHTQIALTTLYNMRKSYNVRSMPESMQNLMSGFWFCSLDLALIVAFCISPDPCLFYFLDMSAWALIKKH